MLLQAIAFRSMHMNQEKKSSKAVSANTTVALTPSTIVPRKQTFASSCPRNTIRDARASVARSRSFLFPPREQIPNSRVAKKEPSPDQCGENDRHEKREFLRLDAHVRRDRAAEIAGEQDRAEYRRVCSFLALARQSHFGRTARLLNLGQQAQLAGQLPYRQAAVLLEELLAVKEYCSCQGVLCFTFVQTDLNSAAEFRILQPFEGKQGSLDAT